MKKILAAVDMSRTTDSVVTEVAALARAIKARVILLTVVQPPVLTSEYAPMIENIVEITAVAEKAAARHLTAIQKRLKARGVAAVGLHVSGSAVAHILEQAKKLSVDYIVMGSHGHRALYDLLVGSTTHGVLFRAPCPVVIVPPAHAKTRARGRR